MHGCSLNVVLGRLREAGLTIRKTQRERVPRLNLHVPLHLTEIVDGMLLGDGSIQTSGVLNLTQTLRRAAWLDQVRSWLDDIGVVSKIVDQRPSAKAQILGRKIQANPSRLLYSWGYQELKDQRTRWCPEGVKRVPKDVVLTPRSVALWFCGDGTSSSTGCLKFCTQGFERDDVVFLAKRLGEVVGIHATCGKTKNGPILQILRRDDAVILRDYMLEHVHPCFLYKLSRVRPAIPWGQAVRRLSPTQVEFFRERYAQGYTATKLASLCGLSIPAVINFLTGKTYAHEGGPIATKIRHPGRPGPREVGACP